MTVAGQDSRGALLPHGVPRQFHLLAKPTGAVCNLDCTYCFFQARSCLKQAEAALAVTPDRLIAAVGYLVAAGGALAEGLAAVAVQILDRARAGWPVPAWLGQQLAMARSRACAAAGRISVFCGALTHFTRPTLTTSSLWPPPPTAAISPMSAARAARGSIWL